MIASSVNLVIEFTSDWLASSGGAGSGDVDELVRRGDDELPVAPMSSVKGVIREAAERLAEAGNPAWANGKVGDLFGLRPQERGGPSPGALMFAGEARLLEAEQVAFAAAPAARQALFGRRSATRIDAASGVAEARTLRSAETAVPMTLVGEVRVRPGAPADWRERLDEAAAWTLALGKGKADGLGRVAVRLEDAAPRTALEVEPGCERLILLLEQTEPAAFSARSATEGAHETRLCVPGSALLGWVARSYDAFGDKLGVFHAGKVRFGDARSLAADGSLLWPMPKALMEPKLGRGGVGADGKLTSKAAAGRPPKPAPQHERLSPKLLTGAGLTGKVRTRLALRTAMEKGRPKTGQLFGYVSLVGRGERFVSVIERRGLNDEDWKRIGKAFETPELLLGRAAAAGQGGAFRITKLPDQDLTPITPEPEPGRLVVWALSDIAILDENGEPDLAPPPQSLGLAKKGHLVQKDSAITARRYGHWNAHLGCRDVEHAVIEAGSVLVYQIDDAPDDAWPSAVGLHQAQGLGRIWLQPPLLGDLAKGPGHAAVVSAAPLLGVEGAPAPTPGAPGAAPLCDWAKARIAARRTRSDHLATFHRDWRPDLAAFYAAPPAGEGPSVSQWSKAAVAAQASSDLATAIQRLFEGADPVCGRPDQKSAAGDWLKQRLANAGSLREWLRARLETAEDKGEAEALLKLAAGEARDLATAAQEARR